MIQLLDEAINQVKILPESQQERIALLIMKLALINIDDDFHQLAKQVKKRLQQEVSLISAPTPKS